MTFANTGTEPIKCWVLSAPVAVSTVTGPVGWRTRITSVKSVFGAASDTGTSASPRPGPQPSLRPEALRLPGAVCEARQRAADQAGAASKPPGTLRLNLKRLAFVCQANCGAGKLGRVEKRMVSGRQLKALFGTTLAYGIKTTCGGKTRTSTLKVAVDRTGRLRQVR